MKKVLSPFHRLQWKLTLSYTLVTVVTLFILETIVIVATNTVTYQTPQYGVTITLALKDASIPLAPVLQGPDREEALQTWVSHTVAGNALILNGPTTGGTDGMALASVAAPETLVAVVDAAGVTLASNHPETAPTHHPLASGLDARSTGLLQEAFLKANANRRLWYRAGNQIVSVAPVLDEQGQAIGAIFLQLIHPNQLTLVGYTLLSTIPATLLTGIGAGLIGTFFGALSARGLARRFKRLSQATVAWGEGNLSPRINDTANDEIGQLTRDLNHMADDLQTLLQTREDLAAAEERNRMARDLHDSVKQQVFATRMNLGAVKTLWERNPAEAHGRLDAAIALVGQSQQELNALIQTLRPVAWDEKGLGEALRETAGLWEQQSQIPIRCQAEDGRGLARELADGLYRIAQEALANAVRHSGASEIRVALEVSPEQARLQITDNGHGFDPTVPSEGVGLRSIHERCRALGGELHLASDAGGTQVRVCVPRLAPRSETGGKHERAV